RGTGLELPRTTVGVSRWRRFRAAVDWPLIITVLLLCAIGLLNLYSATHGVRHHKKFDYQVQWMILGAILFVAITVVDYRALVRLAWLGLGIAIAGLLLARLLGAPDASSTSHGSTYRWLHIGGMGIQPSELTKLMVILVLARMFQDQDTTLIPRHMLALQLATIAVPIGLIAIQPDLGTATLLTLIVLSVGFLAMSSVWPMVYITLAGLLGIPILWESMHEYQKNRILGFIDCNVAPTASCWHTQQSVYAVGSGKVLGKGFLDGTQNQFNFVPEHWTDFPYSVWAEEWGFVGSAFLIAIFGFLLVWIINVALSARDRMGAVICVGVAAMTFWHVVVNIAMVLGIAPVVGVTLPFISYGGSSVITFFLSMGLVANVSLRKHGY
ncbi:MAG: rod shape-determining protein RodA, partial [Deltaproteobacteria bacterium]|nr:rod shape-determining protein RodA [Deltaproteobacteria bacterium]